MPSPSTSQATHRPDLADSFMEFDLSMQQRGYIATQVLPVIETMKATGPFGKIPIEQLLSNPDTARAPGSGYARGNWTFTKDSFSCEEHGWEEPVDDNEAEMYADFFNAEVISTARAFEMVLSNAERRAAALLFNATTFSATTITNEWDDKANATPLDDIEASVQRVYAACGMWPNALIINRKVFRNVRRTDQVIDQLKYQGFVDVRAENITTSALAQCLDLERVMVANTTQNTANKGLAASLSPIWSDEYAMVAKVATSQDIREPCVGRTMHWAQDGSEAAGRVESYREESKRSDIVRVRHQVDEKVLYVEADDLMDNITT